MNQIVTARLRHSRHRRDASSMAWRLTRLDCTQAWELHHYLIAWIGTLFCAFDHPASVVCLAITTGIFVQGLAAYGPAEISDRRAEYVDWSPNGPG